MADFLTHFIVTYNGTPPGAALSYASQANSTAGLTFSDGNGSSAAFETTDSITEAFVFNGPYSYAGTTSVALSGGGSVTVPVLTDGTVTLLIVPPTATPIVVPGTLDTSALNTLPYPMCFAAGTGIATPEGEVPVERLRIGDTVTGAEGQALRVRWIGRQTVHKLFAGAHLQMVRIRAGALGCGLPHDDLDVTADHGMILDGHVINASALVNGRTIVFVPSDELEDSFTVFHVETEGHEVILANGAPSESFIDYRDRRAFDNFQEYLDLYGAERIVPEMPCPRISSRRMLPPAIRARLFEDNPATRSA